MGSRNKHSIYRQATGTRYVVIWDMWHQLVESTALEPGADLSAGMAAMLERARAEGWEAEGDAKHGFTFLRRGGERRLATITSQDPVVELQHFSPFDR